MHELSQVSLISSLFGCGLGVFKLVHTSVFLISNTMVTVCALTFTYLVLFVPGGT